MGIKHSLLFSDHYSFEDIGRYIQAEMSTKKVGGVVRALLRGKKYAILTKHFFPPAHYKFPGTMKMAACTLFATSISRIAPG